MERRPRRHKKHTIKTNDVCRGSTKKKAHCSHLTIAVNLSPDSVGFPQINADQGTQMHRLGAERRQISAPLPIDQRISAGNYTRLAEEISSS
jgi:hypothetical protein